MKEIAFEIAGSPVRFGVGATREVGPELADLQARRTAVFTDPFIATLPLVDHILESLHESGIQSEVFSAVRIEPTYESLQEAIHFAVDGKFDSYVAIGGGSTIDTAKAANLYSTWPVDDFLEYVNAPLGRATPVPGPLKPLIALPTTAGTGSETTGVAIFDYTPLHVKTGIAHRRLKPTLGILDPGNTRTMPREVAAASGLDVLSHAIESYTALPFSERPAPARPGLRPAYQGSNPISDVWSLEALRIVAEFLPRVFDDPGDEVARSQMMLAAAYAGIGFGNAGVHLPHGMSYPVSGMTRTYRPAGYPVGHSLVPHGISVILNAPAVFRFTAEASPHRHLRAAQILGADVSHAHSGDAGKILADRLIWFMDRLNVPRGLSAIGYTSSDIPALVRGTLPQHRVTKLSPRPFTEEQLAGLFEDAMHF